MKTSFLARFIIPAIIFSSLALAQQAPAPGEIPGFDATAMDRSVDPCTDFYRYACGTWMAKNPIPPDQSVWGRFNELAERNRAELRKLAEAAAEPQANRDAVHQKVGDYYSSCMDEHAVEALGAHPLDAELQRIAAITNRQQLVDEIVRLHRQGIFAFFRFGQEPDFKNAGWAIADADQGGLAMPDRDYYTKTDPKSQELQRKYVAHVGKMFRLLGDAPDAAINEAATVMKIETALAQASLERVQRRNPDNIYHKMQLTELQQQTPNFDWRRYLAGVNAPSISDLNVTAPAFFTALNSQLAAVPLDNWKTYMRWHVVHATAPLLSSEFVNEDFDFNGRTLTGEKELQARWKRCVRFTDADLGEALGKLYVQATFGSQAKQSTLQMVHQLEAALERDIRGLSWMSPATKDQAVIKLHAITNKIGYPEKWRDYSALTIRRGDFFGNAVRGSEFEFQRQMHKINKPVDKLEWGMTPPTVNAYYSPYQNEIVFPAGILQPPFYTAKGDTPINFGGIGAVIGHELTHGFDDHGSRFDPKGDLRNWWTAEDKHEFDHRTSCIANEYSNFVTVDDVHLNGRLTLGENTADNGGLRIAYMALLTTLAGTTPEAVAGFTPAQRFFLGWGQVWCQNQTEEAARMRAAVDPHSPGRFRVDGVLSNMPEFQQAFHCGPNSPMVRGGAACHVW